MLTEFFPNEKRLVSMNKNDIQKLLGELWKKSNHGSLEEALFRELWFELGNETLDNIVERVFESYNITQFVLGIKKKKSLGIPLTEEESNFCQEYPYEVR